MAVPIKSNNTQQGCNPISSNCVVWQGPNIPCINLCTGDSVSDVVAKMATELCDITSQTDISLLDLSCFNPLYPTPQNFRDVMQIILNKICALENGTTTDGVNTAGCPSDCEIAVAPCLQYTDNLGNTVSSLPIKDYVILIGNRICTILTSIANLQTQIDALDVRVTNLENGTGGGSGGSASFNVTSDCLSTSSVSLQEYINLLDTAFCELQSNSGTQAQYISASTAAACVLGSSPQIANPSASMAVAGSGNWIGSPTSAFQQIQNLWVTVCDLRAGVIALQEQLNDCCAPETPCPVNLPAPTISVDKNQASGDLFFSVNLSGGISTAPSGNIVISGQEWKLVRFEGTVIPSATGTPVNISPTIPNPVLSSTPTAYDGSDNKFFTLTSIGNSLGVTVSGLFYWENVTTGQQCTVAPANSQPIQTLLVGCPTLPGGASPNFTVTPNPLQLTCNALSGANITIALTGFVPVTGTGVSGTAFVQANFTYTPFGTTTPITVNQVFSATNNSVSINSIKCSSTVTMTLVNVTQNSVTRPCTSTYTITVPAPPAGNP